MKRVQAGLRLPDHIKIELSELAEKNGISRNALIIQIIQEYLNKTRNKFEEDINEFNN